MNPYLVGTQLHEEYQYLNLVRHVLSQTSPRTDRTGTGTLSIFAPPQLRFSLKNGALPLLTTKRVFLRPIFEELMWFLRGQTDSSILSKKNVKIWDKNGSREFLDKVGLSHRREGDLGPIYGFQWRHFGAEYTDADADYEGNGVDQLKEIVQKITTNPTDRRIILSAWNPAAMRDMALPPCHMFCQFYVALPSTPDARPKLSCQLYQRSCDLGLGVPFNIASYALLTHMIAAVTDTEPLELIHVMGDTHVYLDHVDALKLQVEREPRKFPTLTLRLSQLLAFEYEDLSLDGYQPHPKIEMGMSA
ncbi:thymidylate synthase [Cladochytrium replicatum]|nr:thymidylate synthase [Cladochytrium replicatum]